MEAPLVEALVFPPNIPFLVVVVADGVGKSLQQMFLPSQLLEELPIF
jgi:hypothetical protein